MTDLPGLESFVGHHGAQMIAVTAQPIVNRTPVPPFRRSPVPRGFTLIEILVVITVIAILAGLVTPMVFRNVGDAKVAAARAQIETFGLALDTYYLHNDTYPTTEQGLQALVTAPPVPSFQPSAVPPFPRSAVPPSPRNWRGPYLKKGIPPDPWGNPYHYLSPGTANPASYDLLSYGRDGKPGGTGDDADLSSWELPSP